MALCLFWGVAVWPLNWQKLLGVAWLESAEFIGQIRFQSSLRIADYCVVKIHEFSPVKDALIYVASLYLTVLIEHICEYMAYLLVHFLLVFIV